MMTTHALMEILSFPWTCAPHGGEFFLISLSGLCLPLLLCLYLPQPFPYSSVSLRPGDGGWHHPRFWHHCLQRLVRLHRGQTWKVGSVCLLYLLYLEFKGYSQIPKHISTNTNFCLKSVVLLPLMLQSQQKWSLCLLNGYSEDGRSQLREQ